MSDEKYTTPTPSDALILDKRSAVESILAATAASGCPIAAQSAKAIFDAIHNGMVAGITTAAPECACEQGLERWVPAYGFERHYEVSSLGGVRRSMPCHGRPAGAPLKHKKCPSGYAIVSLCVDGTHHWRAVHRLVLESFVGPKPDGMECGHYDNNRMNAALSNLSWVTKQENMGHCRIRGNAVRGELNPRSKLTAAKVGELRRLRGSGLAFSVLAKQFGVSDVTARKICTRKIWSHVP